MKGPRFFAAHPTTRPGHLPKWDVLDRENDNRPVDMAATHTRATAHAEAERLNSRKDGDR